MRKLFIALLFSSWIVAPAEAKNLYIPVAGVTPGSNGTFWRTDLRIYNPSDRHDIEVSLHFLPADMDGRNIPGRTFPIRRGAVLVLENVVATLAPDLPRAIGAIRIDSDTDASYEFIATSRTHTTSPNPAVRGTYGQLVPALDPIDARRSTVVLNVAQRPDVRTNFGAMNPSQAAATIKARLYGPDGVPILESPDFVVEPMSMRQWSIYDLFGGVYAYEAYVVFEASEPVFTWASVIDNASGDAVFISGVEPLAEVRPLPLH